MKLVRTAVTAALAAVLMSFGLLAVAGPASATTGDVGYQDQSFSGVANPPTSDKPQSKLWYVDGRWWAVMFDTVSKTWHIFGLDRTTETWVDTGVQVDDRANTLADALWDGSKLYIASHVATVSSADTAKVSVANSPARLYRYSYSTTTKSFTLDAGSPSTIATYSSESMTIDEDSTGTLWATWTQVSGSSTAGYTNTVYVNSLAPGATAWGAPFTPAVAGVNPAFDDISTIVAFGGNKIGILWSNQLDETVYWAVHTDGTTRTDWKGSPAVRGTKLADDHLNIKSIQGDSAGRVFAIVKTSLDESSTATSSSPQIALLQFKPGTGAWTSTTFGTIADCHTRPQVLLDEQQQVVHVVATAPTSSGCPNSGAPGTIYEKSAPMSNPVFPSGRGTPIIRDAASANMNNATTTKQGVSAATGMVVLASNMVTQRYWHADVSLASTPTGTAPTAAFTASPTSGTAPLAVQFTDTSTGSPTSWAWDLGDGTTSTAQNPAHTYTSAGTYTVTLKATNAAGTSAAATGTITVTAPPTSAKQVTAGSSTQAVNTTAVTSVAVAKPAGVVNGDVLVAQITTDSTPSVSTAPSGWSTVVSPLTVGSSAARVFAYYHVVTNATAEPASWTWTLSKAVKWNAAMTDFHGVNTTTPFDTAAATKVSGSATSITVPGVTTVTAGAMLVGGVGIDSGTTTATPATGWTEAVESTTAQTAELAYRARPTAGATGSATWTLNKSVASGGWLRALRPAS